jgi:uncharacterized repeat protein (TIGR03803 family)
VQRRSQVNLPRRKFITAAGITAGAATLGLLGLRRFWDTPGTTSSVGYGELIPDPAGVLDLPAGFRYHSFSKTGDSMDDRLFVPGGHDGMAAFPASDGRVILVRNHELSSGAVDRSAFGPGRKTTGNIDPRLIYDSAGGLGGTTTLIYNTRNQKLERHFLSLAGTVRNCAGGATPWNSWISCEESTEKAGNEYSRDHGYNFEVPAAATGVVAAAPLKAMGRFNHEALGVDPASGAVFQTEDRGDSLFYRFLPHENGRLSDGKLQALKIDGMAGVHTSNRELKIPVRVPMKVQWVDLEDVESPDDSLRKQGFDKGAARFSRGEGVWTEPGAVYFACTNGGAAECGQIFRYAPAAGTLELFAESPGNGMLENPDNIAISPWGDILACEDRSGQCRVIGITQAGGYYTFAANAMNTSELAGGVFSPDGGTFFVNIQNPGITLAITGPWKRG